MRSAEFSRNGKFVLAVSIDSGDSRQLRYQLVDARELLLSWEAKRGESCERVMWIMSGPDEFLPDIEFLVSEFCVKTQGLVSFFKRVEVELVVRKREVEAPVYSVILSKPQVVLLRPWWKFW